MSSGFISETEILEQRRRRQEEWEKVRTDDQPKGSNNFVCWTFFHRNDCQYKKLSASICIFV